jgi:hypothetical protein
MLDLIVTATRFGVVFAWGLVTWFALPDVGRALVKRADITDWKRCALAMVGAVLVTFQFNAVFIEQQIPATRGIAVANTVLLSAAVLALVVWSLKAPEGHRRFALLSHLAIVVLGVVAGLCL